MVVHVYRPRGCELEEFSAGEFISQGDCIWYTSVKPPRIGLLGRGITGASGFVEDIFDLDLKGQPLYFLSGSAPVVWVHNKGNIGDRQLRGCDAGFEEVSSFISRLKEKENYVYPSLVGESEILTLSKIIPDPKIYKKFFSREVVEKKGYSFW